MKTLYFCLLSLFMVSCLDGTNTAGNTSDQNNSKGGSSSRSSTSKNSTGGSSSKSSTKSSNAYPPTVVQYTIECTDYDGNSWKEDVTVQPSTAKQDCSYVFVEIHAEESIFTFQTISNIAHNNDTVEVSFKIYDYPIMPTARPLSSEGSFNLKSQDIDTKNPWGMVIVNSYWYTQLEGNTQNLTITNDDGNSIVGHFQFSGKDVNFEPGQCSVNGRFELEAAKFVNDNSSDCGNWYWLDNR